jgi:hypothetical protein
VLNLAESVGYAMEFAYSDGFEGDDVATENLDEVSRGPAGGRNDDDTVPEGPRHKVDRKKTEVIITLTQESVESLQQILLDDFGDKCVGCTGKQQYIDRIKYLQKAMVQAKRAKQV